MKANIFSFLKVGILTTILLFVNGYSKLLAQSAPGGIGSSSTNVLWLRSDQGTSTNANGSPVSAWNDISGNANNAAQATGANQPLFISAGMNGLPTLRFDGANDFLAVPDADNLDNTNGVSVFVVAQPNSPDAAARGIVSKRNGPGDEEAFYFFSYTTSNLYFNATTDRINGSDAVLAQPQIYSAVYNGTVTNPRSRIYYNGFESGNGNGPVSIGNMASDLHIGILNSGYAQGFRGDISEVIVYRNALNTAERSIVEAYLGNRYNVTLGNTTYSSTTHQQGFTGIGHSEGEKYSNSQNINSGILLSERNNSLDEANEFVFTGHDGTAHGTNTNDLPSIAGVNLDERWDRIYYIERIQGGTQNAGSTDVRLTFDFTGTGITLSTNRVYYLLYRSGTSGTFSEVLGGTGVASDGKININLSNANFTSGYYTIARSDQETRTWYSFNDGTWDDPNTWSLSPTDPINPSLEIPGIMDNVIIQNNKTVTVDENGTSCGVLDIIDGVVDFGITTDNTFSTITGQVSGKIRLSADNFPSGDASGFANASSGGTVEYNGSGHNLTTVRTFRNLNIYLTNPANQIYLLANYTLNGNLTVERGELYIGNSSSTTSRTITVYENIYIYPSCKIYTGSANARHQLNLYGNFTNLGEVRFTNRVAANYTAEAADGIVDVNFRSATRNQTMMLEGSSRFYRIAIEKGISSTYELYMEATDATYFNLFGYANQGHPDVAQLGTNQNAFGLAYGTVRVGPNITIARTNGGGNYNVSENAILWVDGGTVTKPAGTGEAVVVYGKIKVSSGTFNSYAPSGITTRLNGEFESTGGVTNLNQFRTSVYGAQHQGGYVQSGGYVTIIGTAANTNYYSFSLTYTGNVFSHTGGTLHIQGTNSRGAIFINSDPVNQNVSANATVIFEATNATAFKISSRAPFGTVQLNRSGAAGVRTFLLQGGTSGAGSSAPQTLDDLPLTTLGSLTLGSSVIFNPRMQDVTIGRSLILNSGAVYHSYSNNTNLNGTGANSLFFGDTGSAYFHNLSILSGNYSIGGAAGVTQVTIGNNLGISSGATLNDGSRTVLVRGNITNSGTHTGTGKIQITQRGRVHTINVTNGGNYTTVPTITLAAPPVGGTQATAMPIFNGTPSVGTPLPIVKIAITNSGSGYIAAPTVSFSGGVAAATAVIGTTHELGGDGNGVFGNLELDEVHPSEAANKVVINSFLANQRVTGILTITNGILDLDTYNLDIEGSLFSENENDYSETKLIRLKGDHGDGGVTRYISANADYLYPIGTYNNTAKANRYGFAKPTISGFSDDGKIQINAVPRKLATLTEPVNPTDNRYLIYYWRVRHTGFTIGPNIYNRFQSYVNDYSWNGSHPNHVIGKIVDLVRYGDGNGAEDLGNLDAAVGGKRLLNYSVVKPLEIGEFTAGFKPIFNGTIEVYYSKQPGPFNWYNWQWNVGTHWSFAPHGEAVRPDAGDYPQAGDIAVIGYGDYSATGQHSIIINGYTSTCGEVRFASYNGGSSSRLVVYQGSGLNAGVITGNGTFMIRPNLAGFPTITGDFSDFVNVDVSVFNYFLDQNGHYNIPTGITTEYPNLRIEGAANRTATIQEDFHVNGNFTIDGNTEYITNAGVEGDFIVDGTLFIGGYLGGNFSFNTTGTERVVEVGNLTLRNEYPAETHRMRVLNTTPSNLVHRLTVNGNINQLSAIGAIDLFTNNAGGNNVILQIQGDTNNTFDLSSGTIPDLFKLTINKGTSQTPTFTVNTDFDLNGPTNGTPVEKALQMQNGRLILNNSSININLSTGGGNFFIPSSSGLVVQAGTVNVSGADNGILLDGLLRVETAGIINMDGGAGVNNFIEYSASGNAKIEVAGGTLTVGSQVRRGTTSTAGVLWYTQTAGNVTLGLNAAPQANRGVFEVLNEGSRFIHTGGTLTIVRPQTAANEATVLLEPAVSTVLGTTMLQLGNNITPAGSVLTLQSSVELGSLSIPGANGYTVRLKNRSLTLKRDLTVGAGNTFDGTGLFDLTVKRHIVNSGTANFNVDTLYLRGTSTAPSAAMQNITGNVRVKHLVVEPETSVTLQSASSLEIDEDLYLNAGQLVDGGNIITVRGNVTNGASHASSNPLLGGMKFAGTALQRIFVTGQFGRIEIDNTAGVQLENSILLNNHLTLTNGILQLQSNKLTLGVNANIIKSGADFSDNKMIAVGGGDFLQGVEKVFPTVATAVPINPYDENDAAYSYEFIFPIGVDNGTVKKYTPVEFYVASNAIQGNVNIYPVNRKHITFDPTQTDVLQYFWWVNSSSLSNLTTLIHTHYKNADVVGDEAAYIGARLFDDSWSKYEESKVPPLLEVVFEADDYVSYLFQGVNQISGEYTCGIQPHIPDVVPLFISTKTGNWEDADTWIRDGGGLVPAGGPVGQRVRITTGHTVTVTSNYRRAYKTTINGRLDLGTTINHILGRIQVVGYVEGTGTLALQTNSLPAGDLDDFCNCGGGILEFGGSTGGGIPTRTQFNNLSIVGSALWTMPSNNVDICGNLSIEGSSTLKMSGVAASYRYVNINGNVYIKNTSSWEQATRVWVRIRGNIEKDNAANFRTNYNAQRIDINGSSIQSISGNYTGLDAFNNLNFNNTSIIEVYGPIDVRTYCYLTSGRVLGSTANIISLTRTNTDGGALQSIEGVVEGAIKINMTSNTNIAKKLLPVGINGIKKFVSLPDIPAPPYTTWTGEYFNASPTSATPSMNHLNMIAPLLTISQSEYWRISGPNAVGSRIQLTLNGTSDVAAGASNINNLRIVYWNGTNWEVAGGGATVAGTISNGTITTTGNITFNGGVQYFTIGAVESVVVPTAQISSGNATICAGENYNLTISLTGGSPWEIEYSDGVTPSGWILINSSPHTIPLTPSATTAYTLTAVRTQAGPINGVVYGGSTTVTVRPMPMVYTVSGDGFICGTETLPINLSDSEVGFTYELYRNGVLLGNQQAGTGDAISFTGIDVAGVYTIMAFNNLRPSCAVLMADDATVTVGSSAFAQISLVLSDNPTCEETPVQFQITFNGTPPFTFSLADNYGNEWNDIVVTLAELTGAGPYTYTYTIPDKYPVWTAPLLPNLYIYNITDITDNSGCGAGSIGAGVTVDVYKTPETGPQYHIPNSFGE